MACPSLLARQCSQLLLFLQMMHVLVLGVALSRWGLWTFDLAVSQMLQVANQYHAVDMLCDDQWELLRICRSASHAAPCTLSMFVNLRATLVLAGACGGWRPE